MKKCGKVKLSLIGFLIVNLTFSVLLLSFEMKTNSAYASEINEFIFTPINDTECSIKLNDKTVTKAIIPEKANINDEEYVVTTVAANGFASATKLEKVRLPKSITTISNGAFSNCKKLKSITLPAVESIGTNAFGLCSSLEYLILPTSLSIMGGTILRSAPNVKIYARVGEAPVGWANNWDTVSGDIKLNVEYGSNFVPPIEYEKIEVQNAPVRISAYDDGNYIENDYWVVADAQPFQSTDDEYNVVIPAERLDPESGEMLPVRKIADSAFYYNDIKTLTVEYASEPIQIESFAFSGMNSGFGDEELMDSYISINRDVIFANGIVSESTVAAENVFGYCRVEKIILPDTLTTIEKEMFASCEAKDILFKTPCNMLLADEGTIQSGVVILPDSIITIKDNAFEYTVYLKELHIPNTVKNVRANIFGGWGVTPMENALIYVNYNQESDLPVWNADNETGWNPDWKTGCNADAIVFQGVYDITYELNGGTHTGNPQKYKSQDNIVLNDAIRTGYIFGGWYETADFTSEKITEISKGSSGNKTLYAKWIANTYEIHYDKNTPQYSSVTGNTFNSTHKYGEIKCLSQNGYVAQGYEFSGWNTKSDGSGVAYGDEAQIINLSVENNAIVTLYAQWTAKLFTVQFIPNRPGNASHSVLNALNPQTFTYGELQELSSNVFMLQGWVFTGWNTSFDGNGNSYADGESIRSLPNIDMQNNATLYAQWQPTIYSVTYMVNKPSEASHNVQNPSAVTLMQDHTYDSANKLLGEVLTITGWSFVGWNTQSDGKGVNYNAGEVTKYVPNINNNMTYLYAKWERKTYTVEYEPNGDYGAAGASNSIQGKMEESKHQYDKGSALRACTFTLTGWYFVGWAETPSGVVKYSDRQNVSTLAENGMKTLYAKWAPKQYTVTFNSADGSFNSIIVTYDSSIGTLPTPSAKTDCIFAGWGITPYGGVDYRDNDKYTHDKDSVFYAQWKYKISFNSNGGSRCNAVYGMYGESIYLPSPYRDGFKDGYWRANGKSYSFGSRFIINKSPVHFDAQWTELTFEESEVSSGEYLICTETQFLGLKENALKGYTFYISNDLDLGEWAGIPEFNGVMYIYGTIKFKNTNLQPGNDFGFIVKNNGSIYGGTFEATIKCDTRTSKYCQIGVVAGQNYGIIDGCTVKSYVGNNNDYYNSSSSNNVDIFIRNNGANVGGIVGFNHREVIGCYNYASIGGHSSMGGIAGITGGTLYRCTNYGDIYYDQYYDASIGGIAAYGHQSASITGCINRANIKWVTKANISVGQWYMAQIVGYYYKTAIWGSDNQCLGKVSVLCEITSAQNQYVTNDAIGYLR